MNYTLLRSLNRLICIWSHYLGVEVAGFFLPKGRDAYPLGLAAGVAAVVFGGPALKKQSRRA
jgi:hypothetical protein